jgi:hypothetical protein
MRKVYRRATLLNRSMLPPTVTKHITRAMQWHHA